MGQMGPNARTDAPPSLHENAADLIDRVSLNIATSRVNISFGANITFTVGQSAKMVDT